MFLNGKILYNNIYFPLKDKSMSLVLTVSHYLKIIYIYIFLFVASALAANFNLAPNHNVPLRIQSMEFLGSSNNI